VAPETRGFGSLAAAAAEWPGVRVLDVRGTAAFALGHPEGAGHVPPDEFDLRRMELPPREQPTLVVHDEPEAARAAALALAGRGFPRAGWLAVPLGADPHGRTSRAAAARLWSPSPFLERVHVLAPPGRALDLACGTGRASVFLALAGRDVEGWDVDPSALERARAFADRAGVRARFVERDLESGPLAEAPGEYALVVVLRYLHRPLFPWIARALAPGGLLVLETFLRGQERFGHPRRPRHLLEPGELADAFPALELLELEESDGAAPPVLARLAARRPS